MGRFFGLIVETFHRLATQNLAHPSPRGIMHGTDPARSMPARLNIDDKEEHKRESRKQRVLADRVRLFVCCDCARAAADGEYGGRDERAARWVERSGDGVRCGGA